MDYELTAEQFEQAERDPRVASVGRWYTRPDGRRSRPLYFSSKRAKYAYLLALQQQQIRAAYIQGAIAGRAIAIDQINRAATGAILP